MARARARPAKIPTQIKRFNEEFYGAAFSPGATVRADPLKRLFHYPLWTLAWFGQVLAAAPLDLPWQALADGRADEALAAFRAESRDRGARLGEALALLARQPRTASNVEAARALCTALVEGDAGDSWGLQARFQLARIAEYHAAPPNPTTAIDLYERLYRDHPATEIGQTSLVRLAMLQLYVDVPPAEFRQRFAALEAAADRLTYPAARRDLHLVLADAASLQGLGEGTALRHALGAWEAGIINPARRLTVIVRIAELSLRLGQREQALRYYRLYEQEPRADNRALLVAERRRQLEENRVNP